MAAIRSLNNAGLQAVREFLADLRQDSTAVPPMAILTDPAFSESLQTEFEVQPRSFASRFEAGEYLYEVFRTAGALAVDRDKGIWAWLALFYFDSLCPEFRGRRTPGEDARWILDLRPRRYFRHLLAAPYVIYRAYALHPHDAMILLCQPLHRPGNYVAELTSRKDLLTSHAVIGAATRLYYDAKTGKPRRKGQSRTAPGNLVRFVQIVTQLDVTWDLHSLTADALLWRLPQAEFGLAYRTAAATAATSLPVELL
jgi:hypothetical protein